MKIGIQQIRDIIYNHWKRAGYKGGLRPGQFAQDTAEEIYKLLEADMNIEWNGVHGFPMELEPFARKLERLFGFPMMRDEIAIEAYRWIIEQEKEGKTVKKFIEWASDPERIRYIAKYKNPGMIKNDYVLAFESKGYNPQNLEVGF